MPPDEWGIEDGYWDVAGRWHETSEETRRALRVAMGGHDDVADPPPRSRPVWFVRHGTSPTIERPAELVLEDGSGAEAQLALPPDLPLGYHDLHPSDGGPPTRLIVVPDRCHLPAALRTWGWTVQLYGARSQGSWGLGDLADLRRLGAWSRDLGAGLIAINPLHAPLPLDEQEPSPYFPSSRRFWSPLYIRVEEVPGFDPSDPNIADAASAGRALNADRLIDRDRVWALKRRVLERLWDQADTVGPDAYLAEQGTPLRQYATFCALAEHHGTDWREWPAEHRRPTGPGVLRFAAMHRDRVRFHAWLQWLLDTQFRAAANEVPVFTDLAVGFAPGGADAWIWQDICAHGARVGAPPDEFNGRGQDWGIPPFVPWRLRAAGYEPFVLTLRAALRHAGGVRIDHVMGLFRLFWIPPAGAAADGTYVRYPDEELLDIVALESVRAGAVIVGEDLGTVEDSARASLEARGVLSYRLVWFERDPPERYPEQALAAVTTHDLPTIAGLWTGADIAAQRTAGLEPNEEGTLEMRKHLAAVAGVPDDAGACDVVAAAHRGLAGAPSMVVTATLDDALCVVERPNMPGTTSPDYPNWSIALPAPLESVEADERVERVVRALALGRSGGDDPRERLKEGPD